MNCTQCGREIASPREAYGYPENFCLECYMSEVQCPDCEGTGNAPCDSCDGTGECECDCCGHEHQCYNCDGNGKDENEPCDKCLGEGRIRIQRQEKATQEVMQFA